MGQLRIRAMARSGAGQGKTHLAATFPRFYAIVTTPGEEDTWLVRPELKANCVKMVYAAASDQADTKRMFTELDQQIGEAKQMARDGQVESLSLDNLTNLVENRWLYINQYQATKTRDGQVDTRSMYGTLNRWCHEFVAMKLLTFPGNLIVTVHEQVEEDEAMEKLPDKTSPISPAILGGFRHRISTFFSLDLCLEKQRLGQDSYKYIARTNKGNLRNAKSRYPLPEIIENISYNSIMAAINKSMGVADKGLPTAGAAK